MKCLKSNSMLIRGAFAGLALIGASNAIAATHLWQFDPMSNGDHNNAAGTILSSTTTYDDATEVFTWYTTFGAVPGQPSLHTNGFTLAVSPGPNPKNHPGEMALIYFDASHASPILTIYGYNAQNDQTSYRDGSNAGGTQMPDRIFSSLNDPMNILSDLRATKNGDGTWTLGFSIDATSIVHHTPLYPDAVDPWTGMSYGGNIGLWLHPTAGTSSAYTNNYLNSWSSRTQGWLDRNMETTTLVPEPASLGLLLGGGALGIARRRRLSK